MNTNLQSWLNGNDAHISIAIKDCCYTFFRIPARERLEVLYYQRAYHKTKTELKSNFEYGGIYDKQSGIIYDPQFNMWNTFDIPDYENSKSKIVERATKRIRKIVDATLDNNRNNLSVKSLKEVKDEYARTRAEEYCEHSAIDTARKMFLRGDTLDDIRVKCWYEEKNPNDDDFLDSIEDMESYCGRKAQSFLDNNQESLYIKFIENDAIHKEMSAIINSPDHDAHIVKAIIKAIQERDCQSVIITTIIDGKELTFKTGTRGLRHDPCRSYNSWDIAAPDRIKFEETYGKHASYCPKDIVRITYGRATIYEREQ